MKICFYANHPRWGQLANNGGSRTILKSCETLEKLGHETCVVAKSDKFTYFKHKKPVRKIPHGWDAYIAVSILDLQHLLTHRVPANKTAVWIRGWETWRKPLYRLKIILNDAKTVGARVFVNSIALQKTYGGKILYPGYDEVWKDLGVKSDKLTIGSLYHKSMAKNYRDFKKLKKALGDRYNYVEAGRKVRDDNGMLKLYNKCDIWFAPTSSEGLHCPPMEAALCGCLVVCSDSSSNGMVPDYATQTTALIYKHGNVKQAAEMIEKSGFYEIHRMREKIKKDIGARAENMIDLVREVKSWK